MKANEFIKQFGLEKAKEVLSSMAESGWATHFLNYRPSMYANTAINKDFIGLDELKTAVDAHELVNKVGGLEMAQKQVKQAHEHGYQTISILTKVKNKEGKTFEGFGCLWIDKLEAAIKVVQS